MKKYFCLLFCFFSLYLFAQNNPYQSADKQTKEILNNVDKLIEERKYETAFHTLPVDTNNEYLLAKKIDICINYFAQSFGHQMFAFKDLEENESLSSVRTGDGSFNMSMFDPVKQVQSFEGRNGKKAILNYELGLYYSSVYECYEGRWFTSDEEVLTKVVTLLENALNQNSYDGWSLSELALSYFRLGDLDNAYKIYRKKLELKEDFSVSDDYNFGAVCYYSKKLDEAITFLEKSITGYEGEPDFQFDAYYLCSNICLMTEQFVKAEKYLIECKNIYTDDYRVNINYVTLYALQKDKTKTLEKSKEFFAQNPENPTSPQMIMQEYFNASVQEWLPDFYESIIPVYKENIKISQNIFFHYAAALSYLGEKKEASDMAKKAKEKFKMDNSLTNEIEEMLNEIIIE